MSASISPDVEVPDVTAETGSRPEGDPPAGAGDIPVVEDTPRVAATPPPADADAGAGDDIACQLSVGDRRFLLAAGGILLLLAGAHWALLSGFGLQEIEIGRQPARQYDFQVDINHATWIEWMQLENIGEITARKIIADRDARGPFRSIDELTRVSGIGPKTLARIRPFLTCRDVPASEPSGPSR